VNARHGKSGGSGTKAVFLLSNRPPSGVFRPSISAFRFPNFCFPHWVFPATATLKPPKVNPPKYEQF
jgi:hypothetical protein